MSGILPDESGSSAAGPPNQSGAGGVTHGDATEPTPGVTPSEPGFWDYTQSTLSAVGLAAGIVSAVGTGVAALLAATGIGLPAAAVIQTVAIAAGVVGAVASGTNVVITLGRVIAGDKNALDLGLDLIDFALALAGTIPGWGIIPTIIGLIFGGARFEWPSAGPGLSPQAGATFVVDGATISCPLAIPPAPVPKNFKVLPARKVKLRGACMANIKDTTTVVNIPIFGTCSAKPSPGGPLPCTPACVSWLPGHPTVLVEGSPALLGTCMVLCSAGGAFILIQHDGQM